MAKLIRITTSPIAFKYLLKGQMRFMQQQGLDVLMISSDGPEVKDVIAHESCRFIPVNMTRAITPLQDLKSIYRLVRIFRKERPDIVHSHTPKAGLVSMLAAKIAGVPIRLHSNSGTPLVTATGLKRKMFGVTERLTCSNATMVLPNSRSLMNYLEEAKVCKKDKLLLIGEGSTNGIDIRHFSRPAVDASSIDDLKARIGYDPARFYFLFAGRLMASKGIIELIEAFEAVYEKYPQASLILAGNLETHLDVLSESLVQKIRQHPAIHELGWVGDIRVPMMLSNALVHPSHREGFPNVLLQAGALNVPVLCSDCIGNIDIITHGQNGLMFPVMNAKAMKEAMELAIDRPGTLKELSDRLYSSTIQNFSSETVQRNIYDFYQSVLLRMLKA